MNNMLVDAASNPKLKSLSLYGRLLTFSRAYWPAFVLAAFCLAIVAATETAFPALMKPLLDSGFTAGSEFPVWYVGIIILLIFVLRGGATFCGSYTMSWIANNVLRDIRVLMFNKLLLLPAASYDNRPSGQLIAKLINEVNGVVNAATNIINTLLRDTLILFGLLGWLLWLNWKLTLVVFLMLPPLVILTISFSRRMRRISKTALVATAEMTSAVEEAVSGNRLIKLFNSAKYEALRFSKTNQSYRRAMMRMAVAQGLQGPVSQFIVAIGIAVILTFALMQARTGGATAGDFVSFVTAMLMMISPIKHLADTNAQLQRGLASAEAVFQLIDEESEQDKGTIVLSKCLGNISFKNVSYRYQGVERYALQNIVLDIPSGSFIAFVGPSGGGKSSLVNLLPRLYEPESGQIFLDGHPVTEIKKSSLRSHMAIVSQDIFLFNDTIAANVAYGETDPSIEKIWQALQHAELSEFVGSLPEQLETQIGDRGVRLSGGQRQRLSLARAFFKDSRILIMDEATSALDSISARKLHRILGQFRQDRTTLTIAHNLNSIEFADLICVVDKGQIVARGTHGELLAVEGLYPLLHDAHVRKGFG